MTEEHSPDSNSEKNVSRELAREFKWVEFAQIATNIVLAVVGVIALTIYKGQLREMRSTTKAAQDSAEAAKNAASIARSTMQIDQRAWLKVIVGRGPLDIGQPVKMPIRIVNTGKTPAVNMHGNIVVNLLEENEKPDFSYGHGHPAYEISVKTLLPDSPQDLNDFAALPKYIPSDKPLSRIIVNSQSKKAIEIGTSYLIVHGEILYDDVFGTNHWIRFCHYAHNVVGFRERSVANVCGPYNDTDKNR